MKAFPLIALLIGTILPLAAQEEQMMIKERKKGLTKDLPSSVNPVKGELSLIADYSSEQDGFVWVYLINATQEPISLPAQDHDILCKREVKDADGVWRRCDTHQYSWCGNSYMPKRLPPDGFVAYKQRLHSPDVKSTSQKPVRYRLFQNAPFNLKSNESMALVSESEIAFCRYDAMAMQTGPFEDVAAVATGKVKGGQGSSVGEDRGAAIVRLERFADKPALFETIKQTIKEIELLNFELPNTGRMDFTKALPTEIHQAKLDYGESLYESSLRVLRAIKERQGLQSELWDYVSSQVQDPKFPWRGTALPWLIYNWKYEKEPSKILLNPILDNPADPVILTAIRCISEVWDKPEAGQKLLNIKNDERYSPSAQYQARQCRENLFPNPFISIEVTRGDSTTDDDEPPLKLVVITNISASEITLPVSDPLELLRVDLGELTPKPPPSSPLNSKEKLTIKAGEKVEIHHVEWWKLIPLPLPESSHLPISFQYATPGIWSIPAKTSWSWSIERESIQKKLEGN